MSEESGTEESGTGASFNTSRPRFRNRRGQVSCDPPGRRLPKCRWPTYPDMGALHARPENFLWCDSHWTEKHAVGWVKPRKQSNCATVKAG